MKFKQILSLLLAFILVNANMLYAGQTVNIDNNVNYSIAANSTESTYPYMIGWGHFPSGNSNDNTLNLNANISVADPDPISGGYGDGFLLGAGKMGYSLTNYANVNNNTLNIGNVNLDNVQVSGGGIFIHVATGQTGYNKGNVNGNKVNYQGTDLTNPTRSWLDITGGRVEISGENSSTLINESDISNNEVLFEKGTVKSGVIGGSLRIGHDSTSSGIVSTDSTISDNMVKMTDGSARFIVGAYADMGGSTDSQINVNLNVNNNTAEMSGGSLSEGIGGAYIEVYAEGSDSNIDFSGAANYNTANLSGGADSELIWGGFVRIGSENGGSYSSLNMTNTSGANYNRLNISGGTAYDDATGAKILIEDLRGNGTYNIAGNLTNNITTVTGGTIKSQISGAEFEVHDINDYNSTVIMSSEVSNNQINISGGVFEESTIVGAGLDFNFNQILSPDITSTGDIKNNEVNITGGTFNASGEAPIITGAFLAAENKSNNSNLSGITSNVLNNTVNISNGASVAGAIAGGVVKGEQSNLGSANAVGNTVNFNGYFHNKTIDNWDLANRIVGGSVWIEGNGTDLTVASSANENKIYITGGATGDTSNTDLITVIEGGRLFVYNNGNTTITGNADYNEVHVSGGNADMLFGAQISYIGSGNTNAISSNANNNLVEITGGTARSAVGGGISGKSGTFTGNASNNTVSISGGNMSDTVRPLIAGGYLVQRNSAVATGNVNNNTVNISGSADISSNYIIHGGYTNGSGNAFTGNTLNLGAGKILNIYGLNNFENYNFDLSSANNGDTLITVSNGNGNSIYQWASPLILDGDINVDGSKIGITNSNLNLGDKINLIKSTNDNYNLSGNLATATIKDTKNSIDYLYKVNKDSKTVSLFHNGIETAGNYNANLTMTAGSNTGEDVHVTVGGTITSQNIILTSNANAASTLTGGVLDLTSQNTAITQSGANSSATFGSINVASGRTLTNNSGLISSGYINNAGTVSGSGSMVLTSGLSVNSGSINLASLTVNDGASLTSSLENITNFTNNGIFNLQGELSKDISGNGKTVLQNDISLSADKSIEGTLDLNNKALNMQNIPASYNTLTVNKITNSGNLQIDADMAKNAGAATANDKIIITNGALNSASLNLDNIKVNNPIATSDRGNYNDYITYAGGNLSGVSLLLNGSTGIGAKYITSDGINKYTFTLGSSGKLNSLIEELSTSLEDYITGKSSTLSLDSYNINNDTAVYGTIGTTANGSLRPVPNTLTVNLNNGSVLSGNGTKNYNGITVASGYTLNLDGSQDSGAKMSNFNNALINNGVLNITGLELSGNNTDISNSGVVNINGNTKIGSGMSGNGTTNIKSGADVVLEGNAVIAQNSLNIENTGLLSAKLDRLNIANGITNNGTITTNGGTNTNVINGNGVLNINGEVLNAGNISQQINIGAGGALTTGMSDMTVVNGVINNNGILTLKGNDDSINFAVTGSGVMNLSGSFIWADGAGLNRITVMQDGSLDIGNNAVVVNGDSSINGTLKMTLNNLSAGSSDMTGNGSLTVNGGSLTLGDNSSLSLKVAQLSEGESTGELALLSADNGIIGDFASKATDRRYKVENGSSAGLYKITYQHSAEDVVIEEGGTGNNVETSEAWDSVDKASLNEQGKAVYDKLDDLSRDSSKGKEYLKALTALAPGDSQFVVAGTQSVNKLINANISKHLEAKTAAAREYNYNRSYNSYKANKKQNSRNNSYRNNNRTKSINNRNSKTNSDRNTIRNRYMMYGMSSGEEPSKYSAWMQGLFSYSSQDDSSKSAGFNGKAAGVSAGFDKEINDMFTLGIGYAYDNISTDSSDRIVKANGHNGFIYAYYQPEEWYLSGIINYGFSKYNEDKDVSGIKVSADYNVQNIGLQMLGGYNFASGFTPEGGFKFANISQDDYTDSSSQRIKTQNNNVLSLVMGVKYGKEVEVENFVFTPKAHLGFSYDLVSDGNSATVSIGNSSYRIDGEGLDKFAMEAGVGVQSALSDSVGLSLSYDFELRGNFTSHTGTVKGTYRF